MTSLSKAIYAIPLCFAAGVLIKEWRDDNVVRFPSAPAP